jgi:hypothetical protein
MSPADAGAEDCSKSPPGEGIAMRQLRSVVAAEVAALAVATALVLAGASRPEARVDTGEEWTRRVAETEEALADDDVAAAMPRLRDAYRAALRSDRWEAMAAVGDVARRVSAVAVAPQPALAMAHRAYLTGLARANHQRSVVGVLRFAEGFVALGDREMVEGCIGMATRITEGQEGAEGFAQVQAFIERHRQVLSVSGRGGYEQP